MADEVPVFVAPFDAQVIGLLMELRPALADAPRPAAFESPAPVPFPFLPPPMDPADDVPDYGLGADDLEPAAAALPPRAPTMVRNGVPVAVSEDLPAPVDMQSFDFVDALQQARLAAPPPVVFSNPGPRDKERTLISAANTVEELRAVVNSASRHSFFSPDQWATIPDFTVGLEEKLMKQRSLSSDVPAAALTQYAEALMVVFDAVKRYPGDKSLSLYLMLPTLLLWCKKSSVSELSRGKYVATRSIMFVQGHVTALWQSVSETVDKYQTRKRNEPEGAGAAAVEEFDEDKFLFLVANNRSGEAADMVMGLRGVRVSFKDGVLDDATRDLVARKIPQVQPTEWTMSRPACNAMLRAEGVAGAGGGGSGARAVQGRSGGQAARDRRGAFGLDL